MKHVDDPYLTRFTSKSRLVSTPYLPRTTDTEDSQEGPENENTLNNIYVI